MKFKLKIYVNLEPIFTPITYYLLKQNVFFFKTEKLLFK